MQFHRHVVPEMMDRPDLAEAAHVSALAGLRRANQATKAAEHVARPIVALARRDRIDRISMLDVACGGGDVPIEVALRAKAMGIGIELTLLDRSATALRSAAAAAERAGVHCRCVQADLLNGCPQLNFDVVTCSLFLHHIPQPGQVVDFLKNLRRMARRRIVVSDVRRSWVGWLIAWVGSRVLSRSPIVHHDGPASVRGAWTMRELADFAAEAQMNGATVQRSWPWRMLLVWDATE
ncbi:MAG: methyltransferase domain-containing protein [Tepidisphaeraceae bacterium]|jgi:2-polyprenyl-3-methyl-5-hydroxy-6-metoxy-1,4-benzoquinol methylase